MPIPFLGHIYLEGLSSVPYIYPVLKTGACLSSVALLKRYFGGARNKAERLMHSKVIMVTGGTSGVGAAVVKDLATRGAQIIILTQHSPSDPFLVDYIDDLRRSTENQLIYAEQVDLSNLHSIRVFATKWVDNAPPRRLDMVVLCAGSMAVSNTTRRLTVDQLNWEWQVNYLANFHLLSILSPALRAQPPDRDVRVVFSTCASYIGAELDLDNLDEATTTATPVTRRSSSPASSSKKKPKSQVSNTAQTKALNMYSASKLALMIFAHSFQQHLTSHSRPDKQPPNARVLLVDPGLCRTPGTRAWLTRGSLWGLLFYLLTWPIWWLVLKSAEQGAQSYLMAVMEAGFSAVAGGVDGLGVDLGTGVGVAPKVGVAGRKVLKECAEREVLRGEVGDAEVGRRLWEFSERQIERREKEGAVRRAVERKERERAGKEKSKPTEAQEKKTKNGKKKNK